MDVIRDLIQTSNASRSKVRIVNNNGIFGVVATNETTPTLPAEIAAPSAMPTAISVVGATSGTIGTTERVISFPYSGTAATKDYTFTTTENLICDILVVGGGGAGGKRHGGGGGAGTLLYHKNITLNGTYNIKVGKGGTGVPSTGFASGNTVLATSGNFSQFIKSDSSQEYYANGGGRGGGWSANSLAITNGGRTYSDSDTTLPLTNKFNGATVSVVNKNYVNTLTSPEGCRGNIGGLQVTNYKGGGGGGAGGVGMNHDEETTVNDGYGGLGLAVDITGTSVVYAGGGNGSDFSGSVSQVFDPSYPTIQSRGGGGFGSDTGTGQNGLDGTGGGGGGQGNDADGFPSGNGGSGIVIIRYRKPSSEIVVSSTIAGTTDRYISFPYTGTATTKDYTITTTEALSCDILVVGGGGGGGKFGGGGGGGAILFGANINIPIGNSTIKVGNGGAGATLGDTDINGVNGSSSSIIINSIEYIANGGGGGGTRGVNGRGRNGSTGGSGGGGSGTNDPVYIGYGGISNKNTYAIFQSFGNNGGQGRPNVSGSQPIFSSGGGGGAGSVGSDFSNTTGGGNGGTGKEFITYFGSSVGHSGWFAGGGGGNTYLGAGNRGYGNGGNGLLGGGGNGGFETDSTGELSADNGLPNTGGGGGGSIWNGTGIFGGSGGSGIIIIRYRKATNTVSNTLFSISNGGVISTSTNVYSNVIINYVDSSNVSSGTSSTGISSQWTTVSGGSITNIYYNTSNVGIGTLDPVAPLHIYNNTITPLPTAISVVGATSGTIGTTERVISFPYTSDSVGLTGQTQYTFTTTENLICDILVVGGGGGGGGAYVGGGGGAGGYIYLQNLTLPTGTYSVKVGSGGIAGTTGWGGNGNISSITGSINYTALGGGGGAGGSLGGVVSGIGNNGGSGGGGSYRNIGSVAAAAGTSTQFSTYGYGSGGSGNSYGSPWLYGGGGGGASGVTNGTSSTGNNGLANSITGTSITYAGGGGGGVDGTSPSVGGVGGGGGGANQSGTSTAAVKGTDGLGGGGGGSSTGTSGSGGSGIVIIRYRLPTVVSNARLLLDTTTTGTPSIEFRRGVGADTQNDFRIINDTSPANGTIKILCENSTQSYNDTTANLAWFSSNETIIHKNTSMNGRVGIGTSYHSTRRLDVLGDANVSGAVSVGGLSVSGSSSSGVTAIISNSLTSNTSLTIRNEFVSSSTSSSIELIRGTAGDANRDYKLGNYNAEFKVLSSVSNTDTDYIKITTAGAITNPTGTASWNTGSDRRIKENIERASYDKCYDNINRLELNRFNYIDGFNTVSRDRAQLGFIAQEVKDIFPKSISTQGYYSDSLNIPDLLSIDISQINYSLYGAVKKLIELNKEDKEKLASLDNRIKTITNFLNISLDTSDIVIDGSNIVIDSSNIVIDSSNLLDTSNITIDTSNLLDTSNITIDTSNLLDTSNITIDTSNIAIDTSNLLETSNITIDTSNLLDTSNIAIDTSNIAIDTSNILDTSNIAIDTSNILDTSNIAIDTSNILDTSNITIDTSNLLDTSNISTD